MPVLRERCSGGAGARGWGGGWEQGRRVGRGLPSTRVCPVFFSREKMFAAVRAYRNVKVYLFVSRLKRDEVGRAKNGMLQPRLALLNQHVPLRHHIKCEQFVFLSYPLVVALFRQKFCVGHASTWHELSLSLLLCWGHPFARAFFFQVRYTRTHIHTRTFRGTGAGSSAIEANSSTGFRLCEKFHLHHSSQPSKIGTQDKTHKSRKGCGEGRGVGEVFMYYEIFPDENDTETQGPRVWKIRKLGWVGAWGGSTVRKGYRRLLLYYFSSERLGAQEERGRQRDLVQANS